jgi:tRNA pseudouridine-54 N-methylase
MARGPTSTSTTHESEEARPRRGRGYGVTAGARAKDAGLRGSTSRDDLHDRCYRQLVHLSERPRPTGPVYLTLGGRPGHVPKPSIRTRQCPRPHPLLDRVWAAPDPKTLKASSKCSKTSAQLVATIRHHSNTPETARADLSRR